ncbi:MAG: hypothetical protein ACI4AA_02490 [Lachnospiraceae bacterium]
MGETGQMLLFFTFLIAICALVLVYYAAIWKRHKTASKGIVNHDGRMQSFCYRTSMSRKQILERLKLHSADDCLMFEYNEDKSEIIFSPLLRDGTMPTDYSVTIGEGKGFSVLKVTQLNHLTDRNSYEMNLLQNEFWHKKIDAEPIAYFE